MRISDWSSDVCSSDLTVALAQVDRVALAVGQHLDLDVARVLEELLHVHHVVAERGLGFGLGGGDGVVERGLGVHHAHAAAAAAAGGLDDHRIADIATDREVRSEEHTSELQSLMRSSYAG